MKSNSINIKALLLIYLSINPFCALADSTLQYANKTENRAITLGINYQRAHVDADNGSKNTIDLDGNAPILGLNVTGRLSRFYVGLALSRGKYDVNLLTKPLGRGETFASPNNLENNHFAFLLHQDSPGGKTDIERTDLDLLFGYYVLQRVSVFAGYKTSKWCCDTFDLEQEGYGYGLSGFYPLDDKVLAYGSLSNSKFSVDQDGDDIGHVQGPLIEIGVLYQLNPKVHVTASYKTEGRRFDRTALEQLEFDIEGISLGVNRSFSL